MDVEGSPAVRKRRRLLDVYPNLTQPPGSTLATPSNPRVSRAPSTPNSGQSTQTSISPHTPCPARNPSVCSPLKPADLPPSKDLPSTNNFTSTDGSPSSSSWASTGHAPQADDLAACDVPSDAMAAVLLLRREFQNAAASAGSASGAALSMRPLLLKAHVHTLLADRTQADQALDELRRTNAVRWFKLPTGADEHAIMLTQDYIALLEAHAANQKEQSQSQRPSQSHEVEDFSQADGEREGVGPPPVSVFLRVAHQVLPRCPDVSISKARLLQLLAGGLPPHNSTCTTSGSSSAQRVRRKVPRVSVGDENDVSALLTSGFLTRHPRDDDSYFFSIPDVGTVVKSISAGRKELLGLLSRRKYGEVKEKELLQRTRLRFSLLGTAWHVRDILGKGLARRIPTTCGAMLKLVQAQR